MTKRSTSRFTRRKLLGYSAGAAASVVAAPALVLGKGAHNWKMATSWPPALPVLQEGPERFAKHVTEASNGELTIRVFAGGELIPPLEVFDSVRAGIIEAGASSPYYWAGKSKAAQLFGSLPFGMTAQQFSAWMIGGNGQQLWDELYAKFQLKPFSFGNSGVQMGGWFNKEITSVADFQGLKMRMPGLGAKVLAKLGANVVLMPGSEIYTALERGTIDATEWLSPYLDARMGLQRAAKVYHYPGWHEPQSNLELTINKARWDALPKHLQRIVHDAAAETDQWTLAKFEAENAIWLEKLRADKKLVIKPFPADVLAALKKAADEVLTELAAEDAETKKIWDSYRAFRDRARAWHAVGEGAYIDALG